MSGYTDHPAVRQAAGGAERGFLQKPFKSVELARIVRQRLDARPAPRDAAAVGAPAAG
jgi:hypothetical protein